LIIFAARPGKSTMSLVPTENALFCNWIQPLSVLPSKRETGALACVCATAMRENAQVAAAAAATFNPEAKNARRFESLSSFRIGSLLGVRTTWSCMTQFLG